MSNLKAIIIDDEPLAHRVIEMYTADIPFLDIVGHFYFATDAYELLSTHSVDLIFLDINMPRLKGFEFLRTLPDPPAIIVTTAYEEHALEGFELRVTDYLLKPFAFDRFLKAVNVVKNDNLQNQKPPKFKNIFVKVDKRQIQLDPDQIQCLESYGNYVKIWIGDEMLLTQNTLSNFETELTDDKFQRIHKSFLVNKNYIAYIEGNTIHLINKMTIPIGKNYRKMVREWYQ